MSTAAFNTLEFFDTLEQGGFSEHQARTMASAMQKAWTSIDVATRQDIVQLRSATQQGIAELRIATQQDIAELRTATQQDIAELRAATQQDIAELRAATQQDIAELRTATQQDIAELRHEMGELRSEVRHEIHDLRKDMASMEERFDSKLEALGSRMTIHLGTIVVVALTAFTALSKLI